RSFVDALIGAGKRLLIGESLFMTIFMNTGHDKKRVSFAAPYPGKIVPIRLTDVGGELITQKDSFLAAAKGVSIGIACQKRIVAAARQTGRGGREEGSVLGTIGDILSGDR